jgi:hypothetical protein
VAEPSSSWVLGRGNRFALLLDDWIGLSPPTTLRLLGGGCPAIPVSSPLKEVDGLGEDDDCEDDPPCGLPESVSLFLVLCWLLKHRVAPTEPQDR